MTMTWVGVGAGICLELEPEPEPEISKMGGSVNPAFQQHNHSKNDTI